LPKEKEEVTSLLSTFNAMDEEMQVKDELSATLSGI